MEKFDTLKSTNNARSGLKWQVVKKFIISEVSSGKYRPGDVLPSENYLTDKVGVSRNTIRQAFEELEKEGYIYRVRGKGTFVSRPAPVKNTNKSSIFGLVVPEIRRSLYPSLVQGFGQEQAGKSQQTLICQTNNDVHQQGNIILQLLHCGVNGLAIVPVTIGQTPVFQIEMVLDSGIPVVTCHRAIPGADVPVVTWNRELAGQMACREFLKLGHRSIAYYGVHRYVVTEAHVAGMRQTLRQAGLSLPDTHIVWDPPSDTSEQDRCKQEQFLKLLNSENPPTAVFCSDDNEAERIYWLLTDKGMKVPDDLSIISFGNSLRDTVFREHLTSIVVNEHEQGTLAARILHEMTTGKRPINDSEVFVMDLNVYRGITLGTPAFKKA